MKQVHPPPDLEPIRGYVLPFMALWLCGWIVVSVILWADLLGHPLVRWQGDNTPPMWSRIILTTAWTVGGPWAAWASIRWTRGKR